jgi:glycosyltransferase involved in cell wall biosynthesis
MVVSPAFGQLDLTDPVAHERPIVDVVVPVYNESAQIASSVRRLRKYLDDEFPFPAVVTIVDNGSTDSTAAIARSLADELHGVRTISIEEKGRGRALRAAWSITDAEVVTYTDVDLSTSLEALLPLVAPLLSGHSDLAIGSRLAPGAHVVRGAKRELVSRGYNLVLKAALRNGFSDAQCGFKAVRTDVARKLLPLVDDESWFFDTELLVLAERSGLRIHEVPVDWVDDPGSSVRIVRTAAADLRGVARLVVERRTARNSATGNRGHKRTDLLEDVRRFASIGLLSTIAYAVIFFALRSALGTYGANTVSLVLCTIGNVGARRWSMSREGFSCSRAFLGGAAGLTSSLILTTAALFVARRLGGTGELPTVVAVALATGAAGVVRFAAFRSLLFRERPHGSNEQKGGRQR